MKIEHPKNEYYLNFYSITKSHEDVLRSCGKFKNYFINNPNAKVLLDFTNCNFIYPDYALLFLCTVKSIEETGIIIKGRIIYTNSSLINYLSRMNFFKNLSVNIPEKFKRLESINFVEIQNYTVENQLDVLKSIMRVIIANSSINKNVATSLDYCLNEVLDNVLNHSQVKNGWVVAQYFEKINQIRIIVGDIGIGIHNSLKDTYSYNEDQSIIHCIDNGVTNGLGQGHGLFATSTFAKLNKGFLSIISGNKKLDVNENSISLKDISYWQGTCIYLRLNTNIDVDYFRFTNNNYDLKDSFYESMFN
jgi:anti-sigma regulatory factor (Ser/Thr protein kinase)